MTGSDDRKFTRAHRAGAMPLLPASPPGPALIRWLGDAIDWIVVFIGAVMALLVFGNVLMHAFHRDIAWTTELCEFFMVWVTFLGGASAARRGAHMTITEFLDKLGTRARRSADVAIQLVVMLLLSVLIWYGVVLVNASWGNILTVLDWPMAWQYLPLPIGSALALLFAAWDTIQILRGRSPEERYGE